MRRVGLILAILLGTALPAAAAASPAAAAPEFHCESTSSQCFIHSIGGVHGTGADDNVYNVSGGNIKCTGNAKVDGTQLEQFGVPRLTPTLALTPSLTGCKSFGVTATVSAGGCKYSYTLGEAILGAYRTVFGITCPAGKAILWTPIGLNCTTSYRAQSGLAGVVTLSRALSPGRLEMQFNISGLSYAKSGTECPEGAGSGSNGKLEGTVELAGYDEATGVQVPLRVY